MAFKAQKNFTAKLDNTTVNELSKKLDRSKTKFNERLNLLEDILNNTEFFQLYFDKYFPVNINTNDYLSLDNNVCVLLEQYATYLLNSSDIKEENPIKYKFYYDEHDFRQALGKEVLYQGSESQTIDYLLAGQDNYKKSKDQKITKQDLKRDDWCGEVLRDYQTYVDFLKTYEDRGSKFKVDKIKGEVQRDMILAKDKMLHVFGYNLRYFDESTQPDLNEIDFTNPKHLKGYSLKNVHHNYSRVDGLLHMKFNGDFQNDFQCILYDVEQLVLKTSLTDNQREFLNRYRNGESLKSISKTFLISEPTVLETIDNAIKKICRQAFELGYSSE